MFYIPDSYLSSLIQEDLQFMDLTVMALGIENVGIDDNFFDRCSRVRYFKEYEANSNSVFVRYMAEDKGVKNIDEVVNFIIEHMEVKSFDNISAFLDEVVLFEDIPLDKLAKDMNLSLNGVIRTGTSNSNDDEEDLF